MNEKRTLAIVLDSYGEIVHRVLLTDDQIKFLEWLETNGYIDREIYNFQVMPNEEQPEII